MIRSDMRYQKIKDIDILYLYTATTTSRALDSRVFMTMVIGRKEVCLSSCEMVGVLMAPTTQHLRLYINKLTNPMFFQARTQIGEVLYPISVSCHPRETGGITWGVDHYCSLLTFGK